MDCFKHETKLQDSDGELSPCCLNLLLSSIAPIAESPPLHRIKIRVSPAAPSASMRSHGGATPPFELP